MPFPLGSHLLYTDQSGLASVATAGHLKIAFADLFPDGSVFVHKTVLPKRQRFLTYQPTQLTSH